MKITRAEDYAISLVSALAENFSAGYLSLHQIARQRALPLPFLKKIAHMLKEAGLVSVREGRDGGYRLSRDPKKITLEEVMKVFNPRLALASCILDGSQNKCPKFASCALRKPWQNISDAFYQNLRKITLNQLAKQ